MKKKCKHGKRRLVWIKRPHVPTHTNKSSNKLYNNKRADSIRVYALMNPKEIVVLTQTAIQI